MLQQSYCCTSAENIVPAVIKSDSYFRLYMYRHRPSNSNSVHCIFSKQNCVVGNTQTNNDGVHIQSAATDQL